MIGQLKEDIPPQLQIDVESWDVGMLGCWNVGMAEFAGAQAVQAPASVSSTCKKENRKYQESTKTTDWAIAARLGRSRSSQSKVYDLHIVRICAIAGSTLCKYQCAE